MKYLITASFLFLSTLIFAQPGYLGKKLSIGYNFEATPFLTTFTHVFEGTSTSSDSNPIVKMVLGHHIQASYCLNRKSEILANFGVRKLDYFFAVGDYTDTQYVYDALELSADIGIRHYFKHFVAPVGTYHQVTFGGVQGNLLDTEEKGEPVTIYRLSYGIGLKKIIDGRVFFQTEFDINFKVGSTSEYTENLLDADGVDPSDGTGAKRHEIFVAQNLSSYKRYNLKFGIGIIL
ncbi:MAG: hypothetical protein ACKVOK_13325 [Flavobacteriales bacterium]